MMAAATRDPLWAPILTHYDQSAERLDRERTKAQVRHITPYVRQYLVAGTTGDGWEMSDAVLEDWIELATQSDVFSPDHQLLFGAFGETTDVVIDRALAIERATKHSPLAATYAGLTVCAPVAPDADQRQIVDHFDRILKATTSNIAIYQLPQVVKCEIAPETFAALAIGNDRIRYFKDTSGADEVVRAGKNTGTATLLRGAEGDYASHLKAAGGRYDGWLLSTANGFSRELRNIAQLVETGQIDCADRASHNLTELVEQLFAAAQNLPSGNPFSNSNRAVDHLFAFGANWRDAPSARLVSGQALPSTFIADVAEIVSQNGVGTGEGYMN